MIVEAPLEVYTITSRFDVESGSMIKIPEVGVGTVASPIVRVPEVISPVSVDE